MITEPKLARSAVEGFVQERPSAGDLQDIQHTVRTLASDPTSGLSIPFESRGDYKVTWTADHKWRIVFRKEPSGDVMVLFIGRESER